MQVILQRWWDIFCSLIHPNLSPDMAGSRPSAEHLAPSYPPYQNPSIYSKHINVRNQSVNNEFLRHQKFVEPSQFILNQNVRNIPLRNEDYQRNVDIQKNESDLHSQINYDKPEIQDEFHNVWDPWEEYDEMQYIEQSDNLPLVHTQNLNVELLDSQKNTCSHNNNNQVAYTNMTHHVDMQAKESDFAPIQEQVLPDYTDHTQINYSIHREVEVVENINNYEPIQSDVYNKSNSPPLSNLHSSNYNNEVNQKNIENNTQITCPQLPLETSFPIPGKPALPIECEPSSTISKETVSLRTIDYDDAESIADSGLAGAFAQLTMGVKRTPSQDALENHLRRQAWEVGNVDYMGRDSFDNIWSKICDTLAAASVEKPVEEKSMEQTSSDSTIQEKPVLSVVEPTSKEVTASTTEEFVPQGTPQPENLKEIDVSSLEAKSDISQESKPESTTELSVKTITEVAKETVPEPLMGVKPDESFKPEIPQEDLEIKPTSQPTAATTELKPEAPASEAKSQESVVTEIPKLEETVVETSKGEEKGKVLEPTSSEIPKREETVTETPKSEEKAKEQEPLSSEIHKLEETAIETTKSEEKAKEPEPLSSEIHKLDETVIETPKGEEKDKLQEPTSIETKDVTEIKDQEQLTVAEASKQDESVKSDSKAELSKTEKSPIIVEAVDISKTEDSIKEVPKVIETPKTEPSKTIEPAKLEETVKVEEVSVIDEKPKAEELPKVEELSKVVEESLTKDAKTEETMKTVEVEMGKEEVPKVEETTKLDVSSPEVALKLISPVVESVQEAQETSKLVHKPEPEEAVSQVETQKPEEGKLEVLTEPDKPLKQAPKTEEISKDSSKIKETPKQSPKVEEPLKECPKVEESPKTEETPKVESKEPTKVKKVTKEGKEKKVKKVPKSEVKAEGLQEESVVPEGETSTSQSTETPTPPPRKTASGTKKVKAKKPNP